jgi:hypothetical protein
MTRFGRLGYWTRYGRIDSQRYWRGRFFWQHIIGGKKEWRAFEIEGDIRRARTEASTSLAFHDMGVSAIARVPHAVGGRGSSIYHKRAYYGRIVITGASASSTTTLDHGLGWNFPSKIALDIPLHHIASLLPNRRRYNTTKRPLS